MKMGVPKMSQKLHKKLAIVMAITAVTSAVSVQAASNGQSSSYLPLVGHVEDTAAAVSTDATAAQKVASAIKVASASASERSQMAKQAATSAVKKSVAKAVQSDETSQSVYERTAKQIADKASKLKLSDQVALPMVGTVSSSQAVELTLPKTVQMALDYNRDIKVAKYDLKQADWGIKEAQSGKMPSVDWAFSARHGQLSTKSIASNYANSLSLSLPLYTGGKVEGNIAVAKLSKLTAQEEIFRVEQATKLSAVEGYFNLLAYQELKDVADESVANLQGHVNNVSAQYDVGTVAKLDVLTSDVSLANARTNAVSAANNVSVAEANLNNIIGLPLQTKLVVADHRLPFDAYTISLDQAIAYAMTYRPEVLQSMLSVQKAKENIGIADAGNKPTISVGASNAWNDTDFPGAKNSRWGVSGGISYSFYDGGATNAKVHAAKEALLAAEETEQKTKESVALQVKQAYLNIRSAAQRVEATKTSVDQAEESFKIARVRYQAGVGINLDVLDAQLNLNTARTNYIQALYDYNVGIATLEQVMGIDVQNGVLHSLHA
jgi:TolC family type I secretion outer membrane protein